MSEARLPWRLGESILQGRYNDAMNELLSWCIVTIQDAPFHMLIETVLIIFVVALIVTRQKNVTKSEVLDPKVVDELCEEWQPEPLVSASESESEMSFPAPAVVDGYSAPFVEIAGQKVIDLSSFGFLGLSSNPKVIEAAKQGVLKYGVGSCGPRGFYGTFDVHLEAEQELAKFFGVEEAIVFSSGYATVSSVIPAFAKRGDFLICDKGISHALQTGVLLSRANAYWFKHNDPEDLERVLLEVEKHQIAKGMDMDRPPVRKFLVIEGLYPNYGDVSPLGRYLELKKRHCFRIMLDDSFGLGAVGATGKGVIEQQGLSFSQFDIVTSSLANSLGSVGGFCIGQKEMIYHQRLNASGYVFSASSPPYLLVAACLALGMVGADLVGSLAANVAIVRRLLQQHLPSSVLTVHGHADSPLLHLRLARARSRSQDADLLQRISNACLERGVAIPRCRYVDGEKYQPPASLRLCVSAVHTEELLEKAVRVLAEVAKKLVNEEL